MRLALIAVTAVVFAATSSLFAAEPASKILPADWVPALSPSITAALQQLKASNAQMEMNLLSREVADMTDAQLFIAYVRLYERLGAKEQQKLRDEQARWIKQRTKVARDAVESQGGSLAALEANNAEVTFTEKRLVELRTRLKTVGATNGGAAAKKTTADEEEATPKRKKKKPTADDDD